MRNKNVKMLVEAGVMIALSQILSYFSIFQMPAGGSVTPGSMIPVIIFAIRWGPKYVVLTGAVYGVLQFILGPKYSFHPVSLIFDYLVAFGVLGLAGIFGKKTAGIFAGICAAIAGRFISHVISGVVVFASYAPETQTPLEYSIIYNGTFLLPELAITVIIVIALFALIDKMKNPT